MRLPTSQRLAPHHLQHGEEGFLACRRACRRARPGATTTGRHPGCGHGVGQRHDGPWGRAAPAWGDGRLGPRQPGTVRGHGDSPNAQGASTNASRVGSRTMPVAHASPVTQGPEGLSLRRRARAGHEDEERQPLADPASGDGQHTDAHGGAGSVPYRLRCHRHRAEQEQGETDNAQVPPAPPGLCVARAGDHGPPLGPEHCAVPARCLG